MRIGLFTDTYVPDINGVVSSIVTLQKELEKNGHDVFVITNHKAMTTAMEGNVLRLPGLELKFLYGYKMSTPYHFNARDMIRDMDLDVIHVHTEFGVGIFGRVVAKSLNIPVVETYHTNYADYSHYVMKFDIDEVEKMYKKFISTWSKSIGNGVQAMIAPSEKTKETLLGYKVKTPIYVIPTGLNFDKFNRDAVEPKIIQNIKTKYNIKEDEKIIVFVGRIAQEKSIDIPIRGFQYVSDPNIRFMIVGGGPQLDELKELTTSLNLDGKVFFTDKVDRDEVAAYYACADCFVSASLTETQGMTFIEALSCGLPVFARKDEVLEDLIEEDKSGYYFEDEKEFANKLMQYMNKTKEEMEQMAVVSRSKIMKYDSNIFYNKVLSVYYQAMDDYEYTYEVQKIKPLDDYVRISIQNDKEDQPIKILISIEDYFTNKIRKNALLDRKTVEELQHKERVLVAYRNCVKKLKIKDYTCKEMETYLYRTTDLSQEEVEQLINDLQQRGYLNDQLYMLVKIEKMQYSLLGKEKIIRDLVNKGLPYEDILAALDSFDDENEHSKALKVAEKTAAGLKDLSKTMKKQRIFKKLIQSGFDNSIAKMTVDEIDYGNSDDRAALEKTVQKALRNYSRKYQGAALRQRIYAYCLNKGFGSSEIQEMLDEMEWNHE